MILAVFKMLAFQSPEFRFLADFRILAFQNLELKILAEFKILAFPNSHFKILAFFNILTFLKIIAFQNLQDVTFPKSRIQDFY